MTTPKPLKIFFSAGESSGDQHAANMFLELKRLKPSTIGIGMGGKQMAGAGIDIAYDSSEFGVIGVVEVVKNYAEIRKALTAMQNLLVVEKPDLLVCVDYKEFNFKLAKFAKQKGIKVLFYIGPQIWAWRPGRVKDYAQAVDMMAVIFPFEVPYYEAENVPVRYVGHPSLDKAYPKKNRQEDLRSFGLTKNKPIIGILPGSRKNEIDSMLPVMLEAAHKLQNSYPNVHFLLAQADSVSDSQLADYLRSARLMITVIKKKTYDVIQCCDAIMTTSGTASLEIALLGIPMVIAYKLSPLTYRLGKIMVKTPYIGLPNIILEKAAVKELIQHEANADNLAAEISKLVNDHTYANTMRLELANIKEKLGKSGSSTKMALLALEMLGVSPQQEEEPKLNDEVDFFELLKF